MADTDQVSLHYVFESFATRGTTPSSPALKALRVTRPGVQVSPRHITSGEIDPTRQIRDHILTAYDVTDDIGVEFSPYNADDWIEAVLHGTWTKKANGAIASCTTSAFTVANSTSFKKGMVVRVAGMLNAANNGLKVLTADGSGGTVAVSGLTSEGTAPGGATMTCVGFQGAAGDMAATISEPKLTISSTSGVWTALGLSVGEWVVIGTQQGTTNAAFATAACNGRARISAITATVLTFDRVPAGFAADAGTGKSIRISFGDVLDHGSTRRSATIQRRYNDLSPILYENIKGKEFNTMSLEYRSQDIVRLAFTGMADTGEVVTSQFGSATNIAAPTGNVIGTGADLAQIAIDGTVVGASDMFMQSLNLSVNNQMRQRPAMGRFGYVGRGLGQIMVDGSAEFYFGAKDYYEAALGNTDKEVSIWAQEPNNTLKPNYMWEAPAMKFAGSPRVDGPNQDVMLPLSLKARRHPTLGYTVRFQRFPELL